VNINQFWRDVLDALKSDAFGETPADRRRIWKAAEVAEDQNFLSPAQLVAASESSTYAWHSYRLYFQPGPVIEMLRRYKRMNGRDLPLDRSDLRAQMKVSPYWIEPKTSHGHQQRFSDPRMAESCWCISLDRHELGYQAVSDEEFKASMYVDGDVNKTFMQRSEWADPRKGDLFALVESLKSRKEDSEEK